MRWWSTRKLCDDGPQPCAQEHPLRHPRRCPVPVHVRHDLRRRGDLRVVSPLDPEIPPVGEELHLPGGSVQPFLLTIGITCFIVGLTWKTWLLIFGAALAIIVIA